MTEYFEDTTEVVVLVIRNKAEDGDYYLLAKKRKDDFWEFIGGKIKKDEPLEEAVLRQLRDEIEIDWSHDDVEIARTDGEYKSSDNQVYTLHPVLVDIPPEVAWDLGDGDLSSEHADLAWIKLDELDNYNAVGQKKALERLDIL